MQRKLYYLSSFDPGNLYQEADKDTSAAAAKATLRVQKEVWFTLLSNLVWRKNVTIRDIDVFNDFPLMGFLASPEGMDLLDTGVLRLITRNSGPLIDIFRQWALGPTGQHWHHLAQRDQLLYDEGCRSGQIRNVDDVEQFHRRAAPQMTPIAGGLNAIDDHIGRSRLALEWAPPAADFSSNVEDKWQLVMAELEPIAASDELIHAIDLIVRRGKDEGWRRRQYYTELQGLEVSRKGLPEQVKVVRWAKKLAVDQAFYDELEKMRPKDHELAPVCAIRTVDFGVPAGDVRNESRDDRPSRIMLKAYDGIPLDQVALWHVADDCESRDFQRSLDTIQEIVDGSRTPSEWMLRLQIEEHIRCLNACIDRYRFDHGPTGLDAIAAAAPRIRQVATCAIPATAGLLVQLGLGLSGSCLGQSAWGTAASISVASGMILLECSVLPLGRMRAEMVLRREIAKGIRNTRGTVAQPT